MKMLTQARVLQRKNAERISRREYKDAVKTYDRAYSNARGMKANPFSNDTTSLPFGMDNHKDVVPQTEDEIINTILFPNPHTHSKKNLTQIFPEAVSDEVREYWLNKINASRLRGAIALKKQG